MLRNRRYLLFSAVLLLFAIVLISWKVNADKEDNNFVSFIANPMTQNVQLYWKDDKGIKLKSLANLKKHVESKKQQLQFGCNAGMYTMDHGPLGLYIENGEKVKSLNTDSGKGNFYLKPNGVFYLTKDHKAYVCETSQFKETTTIQWATQSGPMLVIDGKIHSAFKQGSSNLNIRNGVGVLPDGRVLFAMSKAPVNLYDFAGYFLRKGCENALYLDGAVSRCYAPDQGCSQLDGEFGVMIGVTLAE